VNAKDYQESRARIQSMGYQVDIILSPALSFLWDLGGPARSPQWLGLAADLRTVVPQRAGQGNAKQGSARQGKARHGKARHGTARHRKAKQSKAQAQAHKRNPVSMALATLTSKYAWSARRTQLTSHSL